MMRGLAVIPLVAVCAGCSSALPDLPSGQAAYANVPVSQPTDQREYRISPLDSITVTVFQEEDLSAKEIQVDAVGRVVLPLIGSVQAGGKTTGEFAAEIAQRLGKRFLENPQVSVQVASSSALRVTVEGSVTEPGVYEIKGRTTLLDALAMAKGPTKVARLDDIVIYREINGQRMGALFSLQKIRRGEMSDPEVLGRDTVVVGYSGVKAAWRDVLSTAPLLAIFRPF